MADRTVSSLTGANVAGNVTWNTIVLDQADAIDVSSVKDERFVILINNSSTVAGTATFSAGDYSEASQGDLAVTIPASGNVAVSPEFARFKDSDGDITITVSSTGATTGTYATVQLPF